MRRPITLALVAGALTFGVASAGAKELKVNNFSPPRAVDVKVQEEVARELEKATGKSLTAKIFAGGQLLGAGASLSGLRDGVVDVAFITPSIYMSELKNAVVVSDLLPYQRESYAAAGASSETLMVGCPECKEDYARQNAVYLGTVGPSPWHLMCSAAVNSLSDLNGKKVRVTGSSATRMVRSLGMVPVNLTPTEIAPALQGGQIDCAVGPLAWFSDYGFWDYVKGVVDYPLGVFGGLGVWTMNKKSFDALSPADRKALLEVVPKAMAWGTAEFLKIEQEVRQRAAAKTKFWQPSPEFLAAMEKYRKDDIANIIADFKSRGVENPEKVINGHLAAIEKWTRLVKEKGATPEAFHALQNQEIYSKVKF